MARKVTDHIRRNRLTPAECGDDFGAFVGSATNSRRPVPGKVVAEGPASAS